MSQSQSILKNTAYDRKTLFKNESIKTSIKELNLKNNSSLDKHLNSRSSVRSSNNYISQSNSSIRSSDFSDNSNSTCPQCGSSDFETDYKHYEVVCKHCGLVIEENIIDSTLNGVAMDKEGNNFSQHGSGTNIAVHDKGLTTKFDLKGVKLNDVSRWHRLKKLNHQTNIRGTRERNLSRALSELSLYASNLSLPHNVRKEAASIYRKVLDNDLVRGRSITSMIAATLFVACKTSNVPRTLDEIAKAISVSKKLLHKTYKLIIRELNLKIGVTSPNDFIPRFASNLGLSEKVVVKSMELVDKSKELGILLSKSPNSIAAAALYASSILVGERVTQNNVADAAGITSVTLRNRYKEIQDAFSIC